MYSYYNEPMSPSDHSSKRDWRSQLINSDGYDYVISRSHTNCGGKSVLMKDYCQISQQDEMGVGEITEYIFPKKKKKTKLNR